MNRWNPGNGYVKLQEYGTTAVWMKALKDGALLAVYRPCWGEGQEHLAEKWIIQLPRGTDFHWDILDKTHRIRWLLDDKLPEPGSTLWNVKILKYELAGISHREPRQQSCRRQWGSWHRGHKHMWTGRRVRPWEGEWGVERRGHLPRKIEAALKPGLSELRAMQAYLQQLHKRWEAEDFLAQPRTAVETLDMLTALRSI